MTEQHLDTVGLREKIIRALFGLWGEGWSPESIDRAADRILREIEALPVGVGEEKGMGPEVVPEGSSRSGRSQAAPSPSEDETTDLIDALKHLLGHCEIAAVMPEMTGTAYVMSMDAEPLERARAALARVEDR